MHDPADGVAVMAVHNGDNPQKVARVAADRGYSFPVGADLDGAIHRAYGVTLRPTTVVIGPDGKIVAVRVGAHSLEQWREALDRLAQPLTR